MLRMDMFRPPVNRAMRVLDRAFFKKDVSLAAARISNQKDISRIRKSFEQRRLLLSLRMVGPVCIDNVDEQHQGRKCMLLAPEIRHDDRTTWHDVVAQLVNSGEISIIPFVLQLGYNHWTTHDILLSVLPEHLQDEIPHAFNQAGHVGACLLDSHPNASVCDHCLPVEAQINLRDEYLPYREIIAAVILDKNASVKTVIQKSEPLGEENEFRVLDYELLAGEDNLNVEVKESGCVHRFDLSKVFWNSRLGTEHERLVASFEPGEAVCDAMAGVGPFAIPAAKKGCFVWANDLNPHCYSSLIQGGETNRVGTFLRSFNTDAKEFIRDSARSLLKDRYSASKASKTRRFAHRHGTERAVQEDRAIEAPLTFSHYIMNLPKTSINFLSSFIGIYAGQEHLFQPHTMISLPYIHCYCFGAKAHSGISKDQIAYYDKIAHEELCSRISQALEHDITPETSSLAINDVRNVAPNKRQFCVSFRLPATVAFSCSQVENLEF